MLTYWYQRFGRRTYNAVHHLNTRLTRFERYLARWVDLLEGRGIDSW